MSLSTRAAVRTVAACARASACLCAHARAHTYNVHGARTMRTHTRFQGLWLWYARGEAVPVVLEHGGLPVLGAQAHENVARPGRRAVEHGRARAQWQRPLRKPPRRFCIR